MTQAIPHSSNRVLASLAAADTDALLPHLRFLDLPQEMVLFEAGDTISRVFFPFRNALARIMSNVGMPSVMHTTSSIPAAAASMMASAANGGGTKITEAFAPVLRRASSTVLNTSKSSCFVPPFPGVTPPTTFVPYFTACSA